MAGRKVSGSGIALAVALLGVGLLPVVGFLVRDWQPEVASAHGVAIDAVIRYLLITTGIIFFLGHLFLGWSVFRFGEGRGEGEEFHPPNRRLEWAWAAVPLILFTGVAEFGVLAMGSEVWTELYGPEPEGAVRIEVVGQQFEWLVRYPGKDGEFGKTDPTKFHPTRNPVGLVKSDAASRDDIVIRGELTLPAGKPTVILLRSHDVLHSFTVPNFRIKQDLVPGFVSKVQFRPTKEGEYSLSCAELCGLGHYRMKGKVEVLSESAFDEWLGKQEPWF